MPIAVLFRLPAKRHGATEGDAARLNHAGSIPSRLGGDKCFVLRRFVDYLAIAAIYTATAKRDAWIVAGVTPPPIQVGTGGGSAALGRTAELTLPWRDRR